MRQRLIESYDFSTRCPSADDLAFHVEEHTSLCRACGHRRRSRALRVAGRSTRQSDIDAYRARFPADAAAADLANWDVLERENPTMFSRMYVLWLFRKVQRESMSTANPPHRSHVVGPALNRSLPRRRPSRQGDFAAALIAAPPFGISPPKSVKIELSGRHSG